MLHFARELAQQALLLMLARAACLTQAHFVDDVFDRDIAGKVPQVAIQLRIGEGMCENAVQYGVQAVAYGTRTFLLVGTQDRQVVEEQMLAFRSQGRIGQEHRNVDQLAQCGVHVAQIQEQDVEGKAQHIGRKLPRTLASDALQFLLHSGQEPTSAMNR